MVEDILRVTRPISRDALARAYTVLATEWQHASPRGSLWIIEPGRLRIHRPSEARIAAASPPPPRRNPICPPAVTR